MSGLFLFVLLSALGSDAMGDVRIQVFVSIPPQRFLVERIGGDKVVVNTMIAPGYSPETYDPTARQMAALNQADLYFRIGLPFEDIWMQTIASINRHIRIIECCREIAYRNFNAAAVYDTDGRKAGAPDPHIWTSPGNMVILANQIKEELVMKDPHDGHYYESNYRSLVAKLNALHAYVQSMLEGKRIPYIIVSHGAWGYYTDAYGLKQVSLEVNGRERGPRGLAELIDLAKREKIATLFLQKQYKSGAFVILADELDAKVVIIDPLSGNYIDNLRKVTRLIAEAVK
ncbi:MAG: metal ABC transporter solute-binding protein, Zn/Mn family [Gammaproteobacteria bacterium]